jgi:hypothetical protein
MRNLPLEPSSMIATPALLSPSPGIALLGVASGIDNPAVRVEGSAPVGMRAGSIDTVSFSALLATSKTPVSATLPPLLAVSPSVNIAVPQVSEPAANFLDANPAAQFGTSPIANVFTAVAQAAPIVATHTGGSVAPPTGKVLPPPGIAIQIASQTSSRFALALPFTALALAENGTKADATVADDAAPADLTATDMAAPADAAGLIPASLILPQPPAPPASSLGPTPEPAERGQPSLPTRQDSGGAVASRPTEAIRAALTAPLTRLAVDTPQPQVAPTIQVALPVSAALAEAGAEQPAASFQPIPRGRAETVATVPASASDRADSPDAAPRELEAAGPSPVPAPLVAPFLPAVSPVPADPARPTTAAAVAPTERVDFATLVDSIARAREHASPQAMTAPVAVSLAHSDFGPVALRFRHDGDALAVTMASADPGFAPAVSAAAAAEAGAAARQQQQQADTQSRPQQPDGRQPQSSGNSGSANQGFAQSGPGQNASGQGSRAQHQSDHRQPSQHRPLPRDASRANNRSGADPDIFA